jgi:hypothetical protein
MTNKRLIELLKTNYISKIFIKEKGKYKPLSEVWVGSKGSWVQIWKKE